MTPTSSVDEQCVSTSEARENLAELLNQVAYGGVRIVLERRGRRVAALVSIEDLQRLQALAAGQGAPAGPNAHALAPASLPSDGAES